MIGLDSPLPGWPEIPGNASSGFSGSASEPKTSR
jgi:hypothetical protein